MSHWYDNPYYDEKVPSVTTILSIIDKPWLKTWAAKVEREKMLDLWWDAYQGLQHIEGREWLTEYVKEHARQFEKVSREAMDAGSWLHNAIDAFYKIWTTGSGSCFSDSNTLTIEEDYCFFLSDYYPSDSIKQLAAFFKFMKEYNAVMLKSEFTVHSKEGYSGTCDAVLFIDGEKYVTDWKTGDPERIGPPVVPRFEHRLQISAYKECRQAWIDDIEPFGRAVIYFRKGKNAGKYCPWLSKNISDHVDDYATFIHVKKVFDAMNNK